MGEKSLTEEFLPSISVNKVKNKTCSPRKPTRLSRSYLKLKNNDSEAIAETQTLNIQVNAPIEPNDIKTNGSVHADNVNYCPNCQIPFDILEIGPDQHVINCTVSHDELEECPDGEFCYSNNVFHYQFYAHKVLAQLRALGRETEKQELRTPSCSKKRPNGMHSSDSELRKEKAGPERRTSQEYRKRLEFDNETTDDTSSSEDFLCPKKKDLTRETGNTFRIYNKLDEKDSSTNDLFRLPQLISKPNCTQAVIANTVHKPDNRKANVNNLKSKKHVPENTKDNNLLENVGQSLNNGFANLSKEKQIENDDNDIQVIYEKVPSAISSVHDTQPVKNHTEEINSYSLSNLSSLSCGYTSKAGIGTSEELILADEFSKNFDDDLESIHYETQPPLPRSAKSIISVNNTAKSENYSMEVLPSQNLSYSPLKKVSASIGQVCSSEVLSLRSTPSPLKKRKGKDAKISHGQNLITSYFQCNKTKLTEVFETSASMQSNEPKITPPEYPKETSSTKKNNAAVTEKWHEIGLRLRKRGYSSLQVVSEASSVSSEESSNGRSRKGCPFYKRIPETKFVVDAFTYGIIPDVVVYFLSHFHADHYGGLRKSFNKPIYCSEITAKLVKMKLGVNEKYLNILQLDEPKKIHGVMVTALDANHCPGSLMFLFQLPSGKNVLHVGDFRADPKMESYPCFWNLTIDKLFLDTTYCQPRYVFPAQNEIIAKVVDIAKRHIKTLADTVFVCGSYTIGKEKIFTALAEALDCKLWAGSDKRRVLNCLKDPVIDKRLTTNQGEALVHVCPMSQLNQRALQSYLKQIRAMCTYLVAFVPTGWQMRSSAADDINMKVYGNITIYGVPYSEHSSFLELRRFVQFLRPLEVIPTVNMGSEKQRATMQKYFQEWLAEASISKPSGNVQQKLVNYFRTAE